MPENNHETWSARTLIALKIFLFLYFYLKVEEKQSSTLKKSEDNYKNIHQIYKNIHKVLRSGFQPNAYALLPNGFLAVKTFGDIQIWNMRSKRRIRTLKTDPESKIPYCRNYDPMLVLPNGNLVNGNDSSIQIIDIITGKCKRVLNLDSFLIQLKVFSDGRILSTSWEKAINPNTGIPNAQINIWTPTFDKKVTWSLPICPLLKECVVSSDYRLVALDRETQDISIWNLDTGLCENGDHLLRDTSYHSKANYDCDFFGNPSYKYKSFLLALRNGKVVYRLTNGVIQVWDLKTQQCQTLYGSEGDPFSYLELTDGRLMIFTSVRDQFDTNTIRKQLLEVWDLTSETCDERIQLEICRYKRGAPFALPDGRVIMDPHSNPSTMTIWRNFFKNNPNQHTFFETREKAWVEKFTKKMNPLIKNTSDLQPKSLYLKCMVS